MYYTISAQDRLLEVEITDGMTKGEILDFWRHIESHPAYPRAQGVLVRYGYDMNWSVTPLEISRLARDIRRLRPMRWAIVSHDPFSYGMTRMFAAQAEGGGIYQVFEKEEAARNWLQASMN